MIAQIQGTLVYKSFDFVIVDVNGVGYRIFTPLSTFYELPALNECVLLKTCTVFKEDSLRLYGFLTEEEREAFQLLKSITGIGPKLANCILSGIPPAELYDAIAHMNSSRLNAIPGVGRKTCERIIVELKDKIGKHFTPLPSSKFPSALEKNQRDALSALINLGYQKAQAEKAIQSVTGNEEHLSLEEMLKRAFYVLSK